jgi:hypothetical protein
MTCLKNMRIVAVEVWSGNCSGGGNDVIQEGFMREEAGPGSGQ